MEDKRSNFWLKKIIGVCTLFLMQAGIASPIPTPLPELHCTDVHAAPSGQSNYYYDGFFIGAGGCLYDPANTDIKDVPPLLGPLGDNGQRIWDVNGGETTPTAAAYQMLSIAISTDTPVIGIYNASSDSGKLITSPQDIAKGYVLRNTASIRSIATQLLLALDRGETETVLLRGGSQGPVLMSRALQQVRQELAKRFHTQAEINQAMAALRVETHGSTARDFPDGPRYVHYLNLLDPAGQALGVLATGGHPGKHAVIVVFASVTPPLEDEFKTLKTVDKVLLRLHGEGNYLDHRVPFDIAYGRSNPNGKPVIVSYDQLIH
jgi:hypothetical protein